MNERKPTRGLFLDAKEGQSILGFAATLVYHFHGAFLSTGNGVDLVDGSEASLAERLPADETTPELLLGGLN